jgi:hypothetical protein
MIVRRAERYDRFILQPQCGAASESRESGTTSFRGSTRPPRATTAIRASLLSMTSDNSPRYSRQKRQLSKKFEFEGRRGGG